MIMLRALRKRSIALLWCGQAASAIGDEIYRVALVWFAVGLIGPDTGYISAAQAAAFLLFAVFAEGWAERFNHFKMMISVDLLRAIILLIPVVLFSFLPISLPILTGVAFLIAGLGAFFDPAVMAVVPRYSNGQEELRAATGLMATTYRLARAVGPTAVGLLSASIATLHFFTLDALSFLLSAGSILLLSRIPAHRDDGKEMAGGVVAGNYKDAILSGIRSLMRNRTIRVLMVVKSVGGGLWYLVYGLGIALLVEKLAPGDGKAFGLVVGAYGIGNFIGAVTLGNMKRQNSIPILLWGHFCLGIGFIGMGAAPSLLFLGIASGFSGLSGPVNDLPFVDMIQSQFNLAEMPKIFRLRLAGEVGMSFLLMSLAPTLLRFIPVEVVTWGTGLIYVAIAAVGGLLFHFKKSKI